MLRLILEVAPKVDERGAHNIATLIEKANQRNLNGEIAIHFPGLKGLNKPIVWVYPKLLVCLDCGFTEFAIPETELRRIAEAAESDLIA